MKKICSVYLHFRCTVRDPVSDPVERLLAALQQGNRSSGELRSVLGVKHRPTFRANYLHPAMADGLIEYTIPEKPNSRAQKYRLTQKGRKHLETVIRKRN